MLGGGRKMKNDNGKLVQLFVGREGVGEEAEAQAEEASVGRAMSLVAQATCQVVVEAHRRQEGAGLE
jgi:hypothetical protein